MCIASYILGRHANFCIQLTVVSEAATTSAKPQSTVTDKSQGMYGRHSRTYTSCKYSKTIWILKWVYNCVIWQWIIWSQYAYTLNEWVCSPGMIYLYLCTTWGFRWNPSHRLQSFHPHQLPVPQRSGVCVAVETQKASTLHPWPCTSLSSLPLASEPILSLQNMIDNCCEWPVKYTAAFTWQD